MQLTICGRWIVDDVDYREDASGAIGDFQGRKIECSLAAFFSAIEFADEWPHKRKERIVARRNIHVHPKRFELCSNDRTDRRDGDVFEALLQFRFWRPVQHESAQGILVAARPTIAVIS